MAKEPWAATLIVSRIEKESIAPIIYDTILTAHDAQEIKKKLLAWAKRKLARFGRLEGRYVQVYAGTRPEDPKIRPTPVQRRPNFADAQILMGSRPEDAEHIFMTKRTF